MISNGVKKINKAKLLATLIASFAVFAITYFALAQNSSGNNIFLDTDQDGLTDQEEKMIGINVANPDTDGDGYSDGKEVRSGYNPLKPAPGDQLMPSASPSPAQKTASPAESPATSLSSSGSLVADSELSSESLLDALSANSLDSQLAEGLSTDPNNLTGQVVNNFLQLTVDKSESEENFADNPSYSTDDINQIIQTSLSTSDISKDLPEIRDDEIKVLPPVDDSPRSSSGEAGKKLSDEEKKSKEKEQIQKYLASAAFVFATNAPFPVDTPENLPDSLQKEQENFFSAMMIGSQSKIDEYAEKARSGIEQIKKVEVPYVLKDTHKSILQMAIYTLDFKDKLVVDPKDPMKNLAAIGSLQSVSQSAMKLQGELSAILNDYGIDAIDFNK